MDEGFANCETEVGGNGMGFIASKGVSLKIEQVNVLGDNRNYEGVQFLDKNKKRKACVFFYFCNFGEMRRLI